MLRRGKSAVLHPIHRWKSSENETRSTLISDLKPIPVLRSNRSFIRHDMTTRVVHQLEPNIRTGPERFQRPSSNAQPNCSPAVRWRPRVDAASEAAASR